VLLGKHDGEAGTTSVHPNPHKPNFSNLSPSLPLISNGSDSLLSAYCCHADTNCAVLTDSIS